MPECGKQAVSDAKKKKAAAKAAAGKKTGLKSSASQGSQLSEVENAAANIEAMSLQDEAATNARSTTGVLTSHPESRDVHFESFSLLYYGHELLQDTTLELNYGRRAAACCGGTRPVDWAGLAQSETPGGAHACRRYGLIGANGCGKSTLLKALGARDVPIPDHIDLFLLDREIAASDKTALEAVMSVQEEKIKLEAEAEALAMQEGPEVEQRLEDIYERLDAMESETAEARAASILHGLGFDKRMQAMKTGEFSGGWRMRISLARALFVEPTFLILDEPTNHLDLEACVWLEETLKKWKRILLLVSHSQDFLNGVCTNIIHMQQKKLKYYSGAGRGGRPAAAAPRQPAGGRAARAPRAARPAARSPLRPCAPTFDRCPSPEPAMKKYKWEQEEIKKMKEYIARFGHGSAKLARQAQARGGRARARSKEKVLAKMVREGLTEKVESDRTVKLRFENVGKLPPPVLQFTEVAFGYTRDKVGPNGAGKSTLLKLMTGQLDPLDGMVKRHNHLRIGQYHQHLTELLPDDLSPLEYMLKEFGRDVGEEKMRSAIGRFGMRKLSDGLKSRVVFAWLANKMPHMLLLDEPTNHLDIETIDALAEGINNWDGGLVLVSHDFRLISQVANEIWEVADGAEYKAHLKARHEALSKRQDLG
eukprot:scaffold2.g6835.t1